MSNTTGATCGAQSAYPSGAPEITPSLFSIYEVDCPSGIFRPSFTDVRQGIINHSRILLNCNKNVVYQLFVTMKFPFFYIFEYLPQTEFLFIMF